MLATPAKQIFWPLRNKRGTKFTLAMQVQLKTHAPYNCGCKNKMVRSFTISNTLSSATIIVLQCLFSHFCILKSLVSDNRAVFNSAEFGNFCLIKASSTLK